MVHNICGNSLTITVQCRTVTPIVLQKATEKNKQNAQQGQQGTLNTKNPQDNNYHILYTDWKYVVNLTVKSKDLLCL